MDIPRDARRLVAVVLAFVASSAGHAQLYTDAQALFAPTASASEYLGYHIAAYGDTLAAGTSSNRRVHIFDRNADGWTHRTIVTAQYGNADTGALSLHEDTLVAGNEVYVRSSTGAWSRQAILPERVGIPSLHNNTLAVGVAWTEESGAFNEDGAVYVYVRNGTTWTQQAHLLPDAPGRTELLGESIELEGDTIIASGRGAVDGAYVFVRNGTSWSRQARLRAPTGSGWLTVALDGNLAAVGDPNNERVHVFERTGTTWRLLQTVTRPATGGQLFGHEIAFDGGVLAVAAADVFYVYARTASGLILMHTLRREGNLFGCVAVANGGKSFFLSNPFDNTRARAAGIVEAFDTPAADPARGWTSVDVGAVGVAGNASLTGTTRVISGSGADIWNRTDAFHYASAPMTGDGAIIARITALGSGNAWAKFGLMFREDFAPASRDVMALVTAGGRIGTQVRTGTAELTTFQDSGAQTLPVWLMLARSGDTFATYRSADGDNWTPIGSATVQMPATVYVGYALTSHDNARLISGQLDGLELVALAPPPPPPSPVSAPANLTGSLTAPQTVRLTWTDTANDENGFALERAPASTTNFAAIATLAANVTSFDNGGLAANTAYTYRMRAFRDAAGSRTYSNYSNSFTITTQGGGGGETLVSQDIGNVGVAGSTATTGGTITIRGAGPDIWGTADSFHFHHRRISGDFDLRARVRSLVNTNAWAKAGLMVRESLDARARNIFALLTAGNAAGLQSRDAFGGGTTFTAGPWQRAPYWVRLVRAGNNFQGFISANGSTWTSVGSRSLALPAELHAGLAVTSHDSTRTTEAVFESFSLGGSVPPPPPPPPPPSDTWADVVLGTGTGSVAIDDVYVDIVATGADIWGTSDSGYFVYKAWRGDGEIVARVDEMGTGHAWSKAGLAIRTSLAANAANAYVNFTPTNGATFQVRANNGAVTELVQHARGPRAPGWLQLTRRGSTFSAAYSTDGTNWISLGSRTMTTGDDVFVGFAVSSHDMNASTRAVFSAWAIR